MNPTAYEVWLCRVSKMDKTIIKHIIQNDLVSGNENVFDLAIEYGQGEINDDSLNYLSECIINKVKVYETKV